MSKLALKLVAENKQTRAPFLDLGRCGLTEIPDEIGELLWLEALSFGEYHWNGEQWYKTNNKGENNQLSDLTPLSGLSALQTLDVSRTQVSDLTPLSGLSALQTLDVSRTQVSDLTPLSGLSALQTLHVSNTQVSDLTPLSGLSVLQSLVVYNTQVSDLSPVLSLIENGLLVKWSSSSWDGNGIYVENCPLTHPPEATVKQGNAAILNYFREIQLQGEDYLYEAKLLLVGAGGAGKTSLLRRLYQPETDLPKEHETTKGIDIYQHRFRVKASHYPDGREFRLNVWDFAGQEQYRPADTFFFTQRSVYVLLDDTRNDDKTVQDASFKYWLEAVDCFSDNSPVLIFQNEKSRTKDIDFKGIQNRFNVKALCHGDLKHKPQSADKLRDLIELYAKQLPHIGEALPAKWINIRAEIEQAAKQQPTMSIQDYFKLYAKHLPLDETKALHLSQYLHDLGVFLHFQKDTLLKRVVILQNQWATDAVFKMLDDETVKNQLGRFTEADCERLWQDSDYADMHPELLALMVNFELCYLLPDSNPKKWLAPQLLPPSKPTELNAWAKVGDLVLRYRYEFLPKGMINRLMVRKHYYVPRPELAWLTGVLFERNGTEVLVELSAQGNEIVFRARGIELKEFLSIISADLETLNKPLIEKQPEKVTVLISCCCTLCQTKTEPEAYEKKRLLQRKQDGKTTIECPASYEDVNILELLYGIQISETETWSKKNIFSSISAFVESKNQEVSKKIYDFLKSIGIPFSDSLETCNFLLFELTDSTAIDILDNPKYSEKNILFYCDKKVNESLKKYGIKQLILPYKEECLSDFFEAIETWIMLKK